ncbi:MAG TPA: glutamate--tRNA ligase [Labilithrix sp.]|nr:glutamate--tRNA ligase [Labilithrix sp.]
MTKPRLRFAPSPTGYLHIGGVRTALFNWLWARKTGGTFVLRIEDTDQERSTDESRRLILDSMKWLGLGWDEGPEVGGAHGPYTQMERLDLYKEYADKLIASGHAFRCYCTKEELDAQREALKQKDPKAQFKYPGTCRNRTDQPDKKSVIRFKAPREGAVTYVDKVFGEVVTPNVENQDFVLMRSDGIPLYNFGVVVDDVTMGITLVARGRDHMINTPPQILLYEALGAKVPEFAHLPMILAPSGEKLSKRKPPKNPDGTPMPVTVEEYRDLGYAPAAVLNYLARFGWSHGDQEIFSAQELVDAFSWEACGRGDGRFDSKKFLSIDHEHLKTERLMSASEYSERVLPFLAARGLPGVKREAVERALYTIRDRARTFAEAADMLDYFFRDAPVMDEKAQKKILVKEAAPRLRGFHDALAASAEWTEAALEAAANAHLEKAGLQIKDVAQPARVALTGRSASPGLYQVLVVLGRDASLARLSRGAEIADASAS